MNKYYKKDIKKYCDLSNIKKKGKIYDWQSSIGAIIPFIYGDVSGKFILVEWFAKDRVVIEYNGHQDWILCQNLKLNKFEKLLPPELTTEWLYKEGDIIDDIINSHKRKLLITKKKYRNNTKNRQHKYYQYKCLICGYDCEMDDYWVSEHGLNIAKAGCGCCAGTKIVPGVNDIITTLPWAVNYIKDKDYMLTHTRTSQKYTDMSCPYCGFTKKMSVDVLYRHGFSCPHCTDRHSYPEKFFLNVLDQADINYIYQLTSTTFKWCGYYRYDFYLPDYNCIVEVHGEQHYIDAWYSYEFSHQRDIEKRELAIKNGISLYIEVDCRESSKNYIMQSLIKSEIPFSLDDIDWDEADRAGQKNILFETCEAYNKYPDLYAYELAEKLNISTQACLTYLKKGTEMGLCEYKRKFATRPRKKRNKGA